jgi:sulfur carrier protein
MGATNLGGSLFSAPLRICTRDSGKEEGMAKINGNEENVGEITIAQLLEQKGFDKRVVVVEINEEIAPKETYEERKLADNDVVEIVSFVGGG